MNTHAGDPRAAFFDERASGWEERCYPPETRRRLEALVEDFPVVRGAAVLDIGSGSGVLAPYLRARLGENGTLVSLDVSFNMAREAAQKSAYSKGGVVQATAMRLPVQSARMDALVCFAAFPHFSDKRAALAEMFRVLKPGGALAIAHLLSREELSRHHGGHSAVANDSLPNDTAMYALFAEAGFDRPLITDVPGRYTAFSVKQERW